MTRTLGRLIGLQAGIAILIAAVLAVRGSGSLAGAALFGGAVAVAAALLYAAAYRLQGGDRSQRPLRTFVVCELVRVAAAIGLLWAGFAVHAGPEALALLGGFIAALMANLLIWLL